MRCNKNVEMGQWQSDTCFNLRHCLLFHLDLFGLCIRSYQAESFHEGEVSGLTAARLFFICGSHKHPDSVEHKGRKKDVVGSPCHVHNCTKSHDKVPLTLSLNPVSELGLCLLLIDELLREGISTH